MGKNPVPSSYPSFNSSNFKDHLKLPQKILEMAKNIPLGLAKRSRSPEDPAPTGVLGGSNVFFSFSGDLNSFAVGGVGGGCNRSGDAEGLRRGSSAPTPPCSSGSTPFGVPGLSSFAEGKTLLALSLRSPPRVGSTRSHLAFSAAESEMVKNH